MSIISVNLQNPTIMSYIEDLKIGELAIVITPNCSILNHIVIKAKEGVLDLTDPRVFINCTKIIEKKFECRILDPKEIVTLANRPTPNLGQIRKDFHNESQKKTEVTTTKKGKKRTKITPEIRSEVMLMSKEGYTTNEICSVLGISQPTVSNIRRDSKK